MTPAGIFSLMCLLTFNQYKPYRGRVSQYGCRKMPQANYLVETQRVRRVAAHPYCRYRWTKHALEMMIERHISAPDIEHLMNTGQVTLEERKRDILWRVSGTDLDGNVLEAVVAVYEDLIEIKVVTAF